MFAAKLAETAAQRQSGNTGVGIHSHRGRKAVRLSCHIKLAEIQARLRSRDPLDRVDLDLLHAREIDDQPAITYRSAANVVAAGAHGNEQESRPREIDHRNNVIGAGAVDDRTWAPVDHAVPDFSRLVVGHIAWYDHFAAHFLPQNGGVRSPQGQFTAASLRKLRCTHSGLPICRCE